MSPFLTQVTTFFIVKLLFSFLPNEFDTPFTQIICKWLVSKLLKLIFFLREKIICYTFLLSHRKGVRKLLT